MRKSFFQFFLRCGAVLMLAAFPVFAQDGNGAVRGVQINKMPLLDFSSLVKYKVAGNQVDLSQPFKIVLEGVLDKDGKLDLRQSKFTLSEGNEQTAEIAKMGLEAFNESGWFAFLRNLGAEKVKITLAQDRKNFNAAVESELLTQERAKTAASGLSVFIGLAKSNVTRQDEKTILNGLQNPTASGKILTLNFALPVQTVQDMINRGLNHRAAVAGSTASE